MLTFKKIAITGGLATGKTTVCGILKEMGAYVLDTDTIVHNLLNHRKDIQKRVVQLLGQDIVENKMLNREKIAQKVFKDPLLLSHLEKILHPEVREEVRNKWKEVSKETKWTSFVVEIPLLFETEPEHQFDATIVVHADEALCFKRFHSKTQKTKAEFLQRMERQMPLKHKAQKADFVLYNDGNLANLKKSTQKVYSQITQ